VREDPEHLRPGHAHLAADPDLADPYTKRLWYHADGINTVFNLVLPPVFRGIGLLVFSFLEFYPELTNHTTVRPLRAIVVRYQTESKTRLSSSEPTILL
jgi:hypothetical protein